MTVGQSTGRVQIALSIVDCPTPIQLPSAGASEGIVLLWGPPNPHNPSHLARVTPLCVPFYFAFAPVSLLDPGLQGFDLSDLQA